MIMNQIEFVYEDIYKLSDLCRNLVCISVSVCRLCNYRYYNSPDFLQISLLHTVGVKALTYEIEILKMFVVLF